MKQGMQESYEKGVANHSAPSFALYIVRCAAKRKQGYRRGGGLVPERCNQDAAAFDLVEGKTAGGGSRAAACGPPPVMPPPTPGLSPPRPRDAAVARGPT